MALSLNAIEAVCLQSTVAKHLYDLSVLLPVLLEDKLAFVALVLVLTPSPVLSSLPCTINTPSLISHLEYHNHAARVLSPLFFGMAASYTVSQKEN